MKYEYFLFPKIKINIKDTFYPSHSSRRSKYAKGFKVLMNIKRENILIYFKYVCRKFPKLSMKKLRGAILKGTHDGNER